MECTLSALSRTLCEDSFIDSVLERYTYLLQGIRRMGTVSPEILAEQWGIRLETARHTIERTTKMAVRDFHDSDGTCRLKHTYMQLQYCHLNCIMYTDMLFRPRPSSQKNICSQVFSTSFDWCVFYPLKAECDVHLALDLLHADYGVAKIYTPDNAMTLVKGTFEKKVNRAGSIIHPTEAHTPNKNKAESIAREYKWMYRREMHRSNSPLIYWDKCYQLQCLICSHTALGLPSLEGMTPIEKLTGDTGDMSHLAEFQWYQWIWYIEPTDTLERRRLGVLFYDHPMRKKGCLLILFSTF